MPGTINTLNTFATNDVGRGMAFKGADIWIGIDNPIVEQMVKATGVIIADHDAGGDGGNLLVLYDAVNDQFWSPSTAGNHTSLLDGSGTLIGNPSTGNSPYGQIVVNGHYWCANFTDGSLTELDAATGAFITTVTGLPTASTGVGQIAFDGTNLWITGTLNTLFQVDEASATLMNTFTPAGVTRFGGLCFAMGSLWATDFETGNFYNLDLSGNVISTFSGFGNGPLVFDGINFWMIAFSGVIGVVSPTGTIEAEAALAGHSPQFVANDGTPNQAWATSFTGFPFAPVVQQFEFVPAPPASGGEMIGTHVGFMMPGAFSGGTK